MAPDGRGSSLVGLGLFEKDKNGDVLWTWAYPSIEKTMKELLTKKCPLYYDDEELLTSAVFGQFGRQWYYFTTVEVTEHQRLPMVTYASLVIIAKDFNPELFKDVGNALLTSYLKSGTPVAMLKGYLSLFTKGILKDEIHGSIISVHEYDQRAAQLKICIKEVIEMFAMETILIYTALLLKKRIAVFSNKLSTLLHVCRTLPAFVWHRQDWSIVFPLTHLEDLEIDELKGRQTYVAGFIDPTVEERTDLYDIFVNLQEGEIVVNPNSKEYFQMGKLHKEIAVSLVEAANDEDVANQQVVKLLASKTKDIITNLKSLAGEQEDGSEPKITIETIKSRNFSTSMQNFLFNLALAENLVQS